MTDLNEFSGFEIVVKKTDQTTTRYKIFDSLQVGSDPRSDIVLNLTEIIPLHLIFKVKNNELFLHQLGPDRTTKLSQFPLEQGRTYLLNPGDKIHLGLIQLEVLKTYKIAQAAPQIEKDSKANDKTKISSHASKIHYLNKIKESGSPAESRKKNQSTSKTKSKIKEENRKENKIVSHSKLLLIYFWGIIFDLIFFLFLFTHLKFPYTIIKSFIIFIIFNVLIFKGSLGKELLQYQFFRKKLFIPIILFMGVFIFLSNITHTEFKEKKATLSTFRDIHERRFKTYSNDLGIGVDNVIDSQMLLLPYKTKNEYSIFFYHGGLNDSLKLEFDTAITYQELHQKRKKYNPFLKLSNAPYLDYYQLIIDLFRLKLKTFINMARENKLLLSSSIIPIKEQFKFSSFDKIELIKIDDQKIYPFIEYKIDKTHHILVFGEKKIAKFHYKSENEELISLFREKILANLSRDKLVYSEEFTGPLEMYDSTAENYLDVTFKIFEEEAKFLKSELKKSKDPKRLEVILKNKSFYLLILQKIVEDLKKAENQMNDYSMIENLQNYFEF